MTGATSRLDLVERAKFSSDKPDQVRSTIKGLLENGEIKLREIAKFTSFAAPTISQALSGTYEGDTEKLDDALARFYRSYIAKYAIIETSVVKEIHGTMLLCWKRKEIGQIVGHFGCGKSKAAGRFVALNSEYAAYVELLSTTSPTSLLHRIAEALNIEGSMIGSQDDKLFSIIRSLQRRPRLLVVDEADNLKPRTLAILKDVHGGEAAERCAIVLIGTEKLSKVLQDPMLGYLRRRIRIKRSVGDISFEEARRIAEMWPNSLERDELKEAWNWSVKRFGVASLVALMARAYDEQQLRGKRKIDSDCLEGGFAWLVD
jgi:DNA transposition AAA+ family ATPase